MALREQIDPNSPVPLYYQLMEILRAGVYSGEWRVGETIPSEARLCKMFHVSRNTVQKAIEELVNEGVFTRRQGVGTFVTAPKIEQALGEFYTFSEALAAKGIRHTAKVLALTVEMAGEKRAKPLEIDPEDLVVVLTRVRCADGDPIVLETSCIPSKIAPGLEDIDFEQESLYRTLANKYQIYVSKSREYFEPVLIKRTESKWLEVDMGSPAILLDRIAYASTGGPVEFCRSILPGKKCRFYTELR